MQSDTKNPIKLAAPETSTKGWRRHQRGSLKDQKELNDDKSHEMTKGQTSNDHVIINMTPLKEKKPDNSNAKKSVNKKSSKVSNDSHAKTPQKQSQFKVNHQSNSNAVKSVINTRPSRAFTSANQHKSHTRFNDNDQQTQMNHSFISDITDVRQMENTLLQLLNDFHCGKLQAFGQDITFEKMESVREQQERLAKLHFDLNLQQEVYGHQTDEGRRIAKENMSKLIENLHKLSNSIEQLQSRSSSSGSN